ncbi:hypothetical protein BgiMline_031055, partial [Biomphalaria glabrata]
IENVHSQRSLHVLCFSSPRWRRDVHTTTSSRFQPQVAKDPLQAMQHKGDPPRGVDIPTRVHMHVLWHGFRHGYRTLLRLLRGVHNSLSERVRQQITGQSS